MFICNIQVYLMGMPWCNLRSIILVTAQGLHTRTPTSFCKSLIKTFFVKIFNFDKKIV